MSPIPPDHRIDATGVTSPNQLLAGVVRRASDGMLALLTGSGLVVAAILVVAQPGFWPFALPALSIAALGAWGILDRVTEETRRSGTGTPIVDGFLDGARAFVVLAGWCCALGFLALVVWHPLAGVIH